MYNKRVTDISKINAHIQPLKDELMSHTLYKKIQTLPDVEAFMSVHVFCVWDFMNLLKTLQNVYTTVNVPFYSKPFPENTRLINEIVLEEESDCIDGEVTSHFDYYVKTIRSLDTTFPMLDHFLNDLNQRTPYKILITKPYLPAPIQSFLMYTYECIFGLTIECAAAFAFGRETLIPGLFKPLVSNQSQQIPQLKLFYQYIVRHIELDAESHGNLALKLVTNITKSDSDWALAQQSAERALKQRIQLWDYIVTLL